ncbi:MAG: phosphatase PAP2 family protein [Polyangiaceae bacterium]
MLFTVAVTWAGWAACPLAQAQELPPRYRPIGPDDYALTLMGFVGAGMVALALPVRASQSNWDRPILFDGPVRDLTLGDTTASRARYDAVSNVTLYSSVAWVAFDALGYSWALRRRPELARELAWIDAESYAVTLLATNLTKRLVQRRRPYATRCDDDAAYNDKCGSADQNVSFFSGHSSISATSAGLLCFQHQAFRLYGGGAPDALACAGGVGLMAATGLLRIASDNHWASDVAVGYLVGFASGYGLPWLLRSQGTPRAESRSGGFHVRLLPLADDTRISLLAIGAF